MFQNEIRTFFNQLKSIPFSQNYLLHCYQHSNFENAERLSFDNTERFIYYLEHAENFLETAEQAPISIKPVLLFYGMNQLIKTCLITRRPSYPENTRLLAHGVSARKRKKQSYNFLSDEVKLQQYGLFPYSSDHLFQINQFPRDKFTMESLLIRIPEMRKVYYFHNKFNTHIKIGHYQEKQFQIPLSLVEDWHTSENRILDKLKPYLPTVQEISREDGYMNIILKESIYPYQNELLYLDMIDHHLYLNSKRSNLYPLHEVMIHYLILYNLSMICRYETEWWGELLHTYSNSDYSFIVEFLNITQKKIPIMLGYNLLQQWERKNEVE